ALRPARVSRERGAGAADHARSDGARQSAAAQDQDERTSRRRGPRDGAVHRALDEQRAGRHPGRAHPVRLLLPHMLIRILLLLGLGAIGFFIFLRRNRLPIHIMTVFLLIVAGAVAVIFPDITQDAANVVGVGRGADLVLYIAIVAVMFVLLH